MLTNPDTPEAIFLTKLTAQQVIIRQKLVDTLEKASEATTEEREEASRGLITAKSELEHLQKWTTAFKQAIESHDKLMVTFQDPG